MFFCQRNGLAIGVLREGHLGGALTIGGTRINGQRHGGEHVRHIQLAGGVGAPQVRPPRIFTQYDVDPVLVKQFLSAGKHQRGGAGDGDIADGDIQNGVWAIYGGGGGPAGGSHAR